ncbi:hypothetical protein [Caproicibacter fermentans]|uniref:hypothetical protein n=1 Tax=Caproicibacter fermentans TaxID=2576756 RepID=UPI0012EDF32E|nr:hypothetical protein [Caproicibacter fermentans]
MLITPSAFYHIVTNFSIGSVFGAQVKILQIVNIENEVINFFAYMTKREIVNRVKDMPLFSTGADLTISCSHPCLPRWKRDGDRTYPKNCGYCYPCLIRRSSLLDIQDDSRLYSYDSIDLEFIRQYSSGNKINDLKAVIASVYKYIQSDDAELKRLIMCSGNLTSEEIELFLQVYKNTMNDLIQLFSKSQDMKEYIGLN